MFHGQLVFDSSMEFRYIEQITLLRRLFSERSGNMILKRDNTEIVKDPKSNEAVFFIKIFCSCIKDL